MKPAIIVVDYQNDFMDDPKGALPVPGSSALLPTIKSLVEEFPGAMVVYSHDWHPLGTKHFDKWPAHCLAGSKGAQLVYGLPVTDQDYHVLKGTGTEDDGYSAFEGTEVLGGLSLNDLLITHGVTHLYVCGVATEYCVKATCMDGKRYGYSVFMITNATAGLTDEGVGTATEEMVQAGIHMMVVT